MALYTLNFAPIGIEGQTDLLRDHSLDHSVGADQSLPIPV